MLICGNGQYFQTNCKTVARIDTTTKANKHTYISEWRMPPNNWFVIKITASLAFYRWITDSSWSYLIQRAGTLTMSPVNRRQNWRRYGSELWRLELYSIFNIMTRSLLLLQIENQGRDSERWVIMIKLTKTTNAGQPFAWSQDSLCICFGS